MAAVKPGRFTGSIVFFFFLIVQIHAFACNCPTNCNNCAGGIISLQLQYRGTPAMISASDQTLLYTGQNYDGSLIRINGELSNGKFSGNTLKLYVNDQLNATLDITCMTLIKANMTFGSFVVVQAESLLGGTVCCDKPLVDKVAPVFVSIPGNIVVNASNSCGAKVEWDEPQVLDCNLEAVEKNYTSGSIFPVGITVVTYTAEDGAKNSSSISFKITVLDASAPTFQSCPNDIYFKTNDENGGVVHWDDVEFTDNCGVNQVVSTHSSGGLFPVGETQVTFTVSDNAGNTSECSFLVTVGFEKHNLDIVRIVTPDGDGNNDSWLIRNIELYPQNSVVIIDRWGGEIYSASNYNNETVVWKGEGKNSHTVPTGTYFFTIVLIDGEEKIEKRGFIELIK